MIHFVVLRHVPAPKWCEFNFNDASRYDLFWQLSVASILNWFPKADVLIVDDNSDLSVVTTLQQFQERFQQGRFSFLFNGSTASDHVRVISSPFQRGAGEILLHWVSRSLLLFWTSLIVQVTFAVLDCFDNPAPTCTCSPLTTSSSKSASRSESSI